MKHIKLFENWLNNETQFIYENFLSPDEHLNLVGNNPNYANSASPDFNQEDMEDDVESFCSKYAEISTDRFTGKETKQSKKTLVISNDGGKNGLGISIVGGNMLIQVVKDGKSPCIKETWEQYKEPELIFLFTESVGWMTGDKMEMIHKGGNNCNGLVLLTPIRKERGLLEDYKIKAIRVYVSEGLSGQLGSKSFVDVDLTLENQQEFMNLIKCMWG